MQALYLSFKTCYAVDIKQFFSSSTRESNVTFIIPRQGLFVSNIQELYSGVSEGNTLRFCYQKSNLCTFKAPPNVCS